jgi:hypothetical protein
MSRHDIKVQFIITGLVIFVSIPVYVIFNLQEPANARPKPVTGGIHGQYLRKAQLTNAGDATPEDAMESALWAMANGDYDTFLTLLTPQMQKEMNRTFGDAEKFAAETEKEMATFNGMQILARKTLSDDKVELKFHIDILNTADKPISANNDRTQLMVKSGDAWKISGSTKSYHPDWDQGSQPEH